MMDVGLALAGRCKRLVPGRQGSARGCNPSDGPRKVRLSGNAKRGASWVGTTNRRTEDARSDAGLRAFFACRDLGVRWAGSEPSGCAWSGLPPVKSRWREPRVVANPKIIAGSS